MNNVPTFRMLGRAKGLGPLLLQKYGLATVNSQVDPVGLLVGLSQQNIQEYDRNLCLHLAQAAHDDRQRGEGRVNLDAQYAEELSGEQEAKFLFGEHPTDYATYILADTDWMPQVKAHFQKLYRRARFIRWTVVAVIAAVVLGIGLYHLPYFAELRAFSDAKEILASANYWEYDIAVADYFNKYPEGAHAQEVVLFAVQANEQQNRPVDVVKYGTRYLHDYPDGKYTEQVTVLHNQIWDNEIARFDAAAAGAASEDGTAYVRAMLRYMRDHHVNTVEVKGNPTLSLKEYSEYPEHVRTLLEILSNHKVSPIRLPDDMETIKNRITLSSASSYTSIITKSLQRGFNRVLSPDFIVFSEDTDDPDLPTVTVDYTISTQESYYGGTAVPEIWEYKSGPSYMMTPKCYLLGIGITFDAKFTLPDSDVSYTVHSKGDPGSETINVDRSQAYTTMCVRCTERFSQTIADDLGIAARE